MENQLPVGTLIEHTLYGEGIIGKVNITNYDVYFAKGGKVTIPKNDDEYNVIQKPDSGDSSDSNISFDVKEFEHIFRNVLDEYGLMQETVELGEKWQGGTLILKPANESMQSKEIPIETFFHKIVMLRDRLRVLEQNINSNKKLTDEEKVNLQQYITRIYGSLTTFNVLFSDKEDFFVGEKGK
ncbi:MAG: hypothetical protein ACOCWM_05295 [Cyclobacteriaceae bacterium]